MNTSDKSAPGDPGRSSDSGSAAAPAERAACGFPVRKHHKRDTGFCRKSPVRDGRCDLHIDKVWPREAAAPAPAASTGPDFAPPPPPPPVEIPDDEMEALRLLQEAAERHALEADQAIEHGENGDKDAAFNRNARTAAALARTRRALALQDAKARSDAHDPLTVEEYNTGLPKNEREKKEEGEGATESPVESNGDAPQAATSDRNDS